MCTLCASHEHSSCLRKMHTVTTKIGGFISSMISNRSVGFCGNGNQRQFIFVIEKNRWIDFYFHSKTNFHHFSWKKCDYGLLWMCNSWFPCNATKMTLGSFRRNQFLSFSKIYFFDVITAFPLKTLQRSQSHSFYPIFSKIKMLADFVISFDTAEFYI